MAQAGKPHYNSHPDVESPTLYFLTKLKNFTRPRQSNEQYVLNDSLLHFRDTRKA